MKFRGEGSRTIAAGFRTSLQGKCSRKRKGKKSPSWTNCRRRSSHSKEQEKKVLPYNSEREGLILFSGENPAKKGDSRKRKGKGGSLIQTHYPANKLLAS